MRNAQIKKIAAVSLASSLILIGYPAFSANVAGTKCAKIGTTKTVSNIKHTCVKQGSKLIWNKGVAIKPAIKPTPTPTPSPKPSPQNSTSPTPDAYQILVNQVNAKLNAQLPEVNLSQISSSDMGQYFVDPKLGPEYTKNAETILRKVAAAQDILKLNNKPKIYVSESLDWLINTSNDEMVKCSGKDNAKGQQDGLPKGRPYTWANVFCISTSPLVIIPVEPNDKDPNMNVEKVITATGSDLGYSAIGALSGNSKINEIPTWFIRGLKQIVSEYVESLGDKSWKSRNWSNPACYNKKLNDFNYSYEDTHDFCVNNIGDPVSRLIVAEYGLKESLAFSAQVIQSGKFEIDKFLGMPLATYEIHAREYLRAIGTLPRS